MRQLAHADPLAIGLVIALAIAAALGWCCYRLLVDRGHLLLRLAESNDDGAPPTPGGLHPGSYLSDFALPALDGSTTTLSEMVGRPLLLVFVRPDCLFSRAFARELAGLDLAAGSPLPVLIVGGDTGGQDSLGPFTEMPGPVLLDPHSQIARLMRVPLTPAGYRVDRERRTVGPCLAGPSALLAAARGDATDEADAATLPLAVTPGSTWGSATFTPLAAGDPAPVFTLPTPSGEAWPLQTHLGQPLALIFSDPGCPPCEELHAALRYRGAGNAVVVSRGDAKDNQRLAETLGSAAPVTVVVQQNREVARAYRMVETPAAYLIDARGAIAAGPAVGTEEVLALIARSGSIKDESQLADRPRQAGAAMEGR